MYENNYNNCVWLKEQLRISLFCVGRDTDLKLFWCISNWVLENSSDTQCQIRMPSTRKEQYQKNAMDHHFYSHNILLIWRFSSLLLTALKASIKNQMSFSWSSWVTWWAHHQFVHIPHQGILSSSFTAWRTSAIWKNKMSPTLFKDVV